MSTATDEISSSIESPPPESEKSKKFREFLKDQKEKWKQTFNRSKKISPSSEVLQTKQIIPVQKTERMQVKQTEDPVMNEATLDELDKSRSTYKLRLETEFSRMWEEKRKYEPKLESLSASDILSLHLANAVLSLPEDRDEEKKLLRQGLAFEREQLMDKMIHVVALEAIREALRQPKTVWLEEHLEENPHITKLLEPLIKADRKQQEEENGWNPDWEYKPYYNFLIDELVNKMRGHQTTRQDTLLALQIAQEMVQYETWQNISRQAYDIYTAGNYTFASSEKLLSSIHQGGYTTAQKAQAADRPFFENVAEEPWEIANVLSCVNAGIPTASSVPLISNVKKLALPFRGMAGISSYFEKDELTPQQVSKIYESTTDKPPYFGIALTFNPSIPTAEIQKQRPNFNPHSDAKMIAKLEELRDVVI